MKWKQGIGETKCEHTIDIDKEGTKKQKWTFSGTDLHCTRCLSTHPSIANGHTDATCYFLPPEAREMVNIESTQREKAKEREKMKSRQKKRSHMSQ